MVWSESHSVRKEAGRQCWLGFSVPAPWEQEQAESLETWVVGEEATKSSLGLADSPLRWQALGSCKEKRVSRESCAQLREHRRMLQ